MKAPMGRDARRSVSMDDLLSTDSLTHDWSRDHSLSLPDASQPFVVWDAGTRPTEAAPAESPPPSPHLTAGRQKVITPWMFLHPDFKIKPMT